MLPRIVKIPDTLKIEKRVGRKKVTSFGAFPEGKNITFTLFLPRSIGAAGVVLRLAADGEAWQDLPLEFSARGGAFDLYSITLKKLPLGLYFYEFLFLRGKDTLFSNSLNNLDFTLSESEGKRFSLLIYGRDFHTPDFLKGGVIYHVFPDRFCRGEGKALPHGKVLDDWDDGDIPYVKRQGDPLKNDVFFGGNLWGVIEKLDYLLSLGVTVLYLSPIFESASNHRYDTGDYEKVDSLLGGDNAFDALISACHEKGIKVILDGVFNHTGDDSRYFNRHLTYTELGACQGESSPYFDWYRFRRFPDEYECWWGIDILPRLCHEKEDCRRYFTENIGKRWLERGADGWRLDVADELSDLFLEELRVAVKSTGDKAILGEVWENAVTKVAYGKRRRYFFGSQLDSVMNYPLRHAITELLLHRNVELFYNIVTELYATYPPEVSHSLMNIISTHDTERMLSILGNPTLLAELDGDVLSKARLSESELREGVRKMKIAALIQYTVFGTPSLYYGDEAGIEGYRDPFCRRPFPWGKENKELLSHYRKLGKLRKNHPALTDGDFEFITHTPRVVSYKRTKGQDSVKVTIKLDEMEWEIK